MKGAQDICLRGDQLVTKQRTVGDHKNFLRSQAYVCVLWFFFKKNKQTTQIGLLQTLCALLLKIQSVAVKQN